MELKFIIRIGVCLFLSILIGSERQYRNGVVGLRTNVLVAIVIYVQLCYIWSKWKS